MKSCGQLTCCLGPKASGNGSVLGLKIETITCNKLSHCLFDFDCPDFNSQYENEKYKHEEFEFKKVVMPGKESELLSLLDICLIRNEMDIKVMHNKLSKSMYESYEQPM